MDGELPRERRLCHFLLSAGRMRGRGWQGSQAITQVQFIFLPPAEAEVVQQPAIGSFLTPPGGQLSQPVYLSRCQDSQAATMGRLQPVSLPTSGSLSHSNLPRALGTPIDGSRVKKNFLEFSPCPDLLLWPPFPCPASLLWILCPKGLMAGRTGSCLQK